LELKWRSGILLQYIYNKVAKYVVSGYFGDPAGTKPEPFGK